jgi:lipoprotein-releasing system ATP-binding protein
MSAPAVRASGLSKTYGSGATAVRVFSGLACEYEAGDFAAIVGPSGSGKSTLLHLLAGIDRPDSGTVEIEGRDLFAEDVRRRARLRNEKIGFVFQFHHLLPEFSARENVAMPLRIGGVARGPAEREADELLARVGLSERAHHLPAELSGGELQRVAIARAIARRPLILFADEPTGNLDRENADRVFDLLREVHAELEGTVILVTHDRDLASRCDKISQMTAEGLKDLDVREV